MKQSNKVYAILKESGKTAAIILLDKNIKGLNTLVDGKREVIPFPDIKDACIIFDGSAGIAKKPNITVPEYDDLICGTVILAAIDAESGFVSLTEEQAEKLLQYLKMNDAKAFAGALEAAVKTGYLPNSDENQVYQYLSEVKTKYRVLKFNWLPKR